MTIKTAEARWRGSLKEGEGIIKLGSGLFTARYSCPSRFENEKGANPEELMGAALAACYAMALCAELTKHDYTCISLEVESKVHLNKEAENGYFISPIELQVKAEVPDISKEDFQQCCETAKRNCPVSKVYTGTTIQLNAQLLDTNGTLPEPLPVKGAAADDADLN